MNNYKTLIITLILSIFALGCSDESATWQPQEHHLSIGDEKVQLFKAYYQNDTIRNATLDVAVAINSLLEAETTDTHLENKVAELKQTLECLGATTAFVSRDMDFIGSVMLEDRESKAKLKMLLEKFHDTPPAGLSCSERPSV